MSGEGSDACKMVKGLRKMGYEERLRRLKMTTLENRTLRGDMIETWKILNGKEDIDCSQFFQMATGSHNLKGHSMRLFATKNKRDLRQHFYSQRAVTHWDNLPQHAIEAPSLNAFKNRFDKGMVENEKRSGCAKRIKIIISIKYGAD